MDSFYDAPRRPPAPIARETLSSVPVVPDISVLCPSTVPRNAFTPYNQWKQQNVPQNNFFANKENVYAPSNTNNSILKKQVRFESPVLQPKQFDCNKLQNATTVNPGSQNIRPASHIPSFEQMYMANIPNRQLDLSVIDLPKRSVNSEMASKPAGIPNRELPKEKEKARPKTYKEFLESQKEVENMLVVNDSVTDIFNYNKRPQVDQDCLSPKLGYKTSSGNFNTHSMPNHNTNLLQQTEEDSTVKNQEPYKAFQSVTQAISQRPQKLSENHFSNLKNEHIFNNIPSTIRPEKTSAIKSNEHQKNMYKERESNNYHEQTLKIENSESGCKNKCDCSKNSEKEPVSTALKLKSEDDLSARDLLKIITQQSQQIAQQNQQLLLLQQQVSEFITMQNHQKMISCQPENTVDIRQKHCIENVQDKCITSTQHDANKFLGTTKNKNHLPNFSIGLTTSFEVSFRRPPNKFQNDFVQRNTKVLDYAQEQPKIQEITESSESETNYRNQDKETFVDGPMIFQEPIEVRESCPSPEPSIKIDMNDFDDSESDDESSQVEVTFYRNLMGQVNKILRKAQIETAEEIAYNMGSGHLNNRTMHKVKETTLKHLKKIGVNLPDMEESSQNSSSSEDTDEKSYNQEDISFAVKQLLMKYLPADHLAKLAAKESQHSDLKILTAKEKIGAIKNRPDFSFATVQYMKKYNLISNNQKEFAKPQRQNQSPKILDISKLKQQPKLL